MNTANFEHKMAAHCESGTVTGLLNYNGMQISEPMVFGISAGIFFAYLQGPKLPFPLFVHRSKPGSIRKKIRKRLDVAFKEIKNRDIDKATHVLDTLIARKIPTAVQVDMFYMDYIPQYMKVHFNGHYVTVVGKENSTYTVSDCYYPQLANISIESMRKARSARGDLAPRGLLFYATVVPKEVDLATPIRKGIKEAARNMVKLPVPFIGVKGIRMFARKIVDWPSLARNEGHLSDQVMDISANLEDKGTGGAGFRFMYASFLQEAAKILNDTALADMARQMMENGDRWRELSLHAARMGKYHEFSKEKFKELQDLIFARADTEEKLFSQLLKMIS